MSFDSFFDQAGTYNEADDENYDDFDLWGSDSDDDQPALRHSNYGDEVVDHHHDMIVHHDHDERDGHFHDTIVHEIHASDFVHEVEH